MDKKLKSENMQKNSSFLNRGGGEVIRVMTENFLRLRRQGGIDPLTKILRTIMSITAGADLGSVADWLPGCAGHRNLTCGDLLKQLNRIRRLAETKVTRTVSTTCITSEAMLTCYLV